MSEKCKICERDTGGFEYCNEFCEIQGLRSQLEEARELIEECLSRTSDGNFKDCVREKLKEQG